MSDKEVQEAYERAERNYEMLKDKVHDQYFEIEGLKAKIDKATKELEKLLPLCIMPNNTLIHATEKSKIIEETINILKGE
jgi:cell division septum initiation protein DivIVA